MSDKTSEHTSNKQASEAVNQSSQALSSSATYTAIQEMLLMQKVLNDMTNGDQWRTGVTQLGKVIDWRRCIVMESAELIDSYPWKHWKSVDAVIDIENARVE
ncbi:MAG: hypothetical protein GXO35_06100, partial [Gammaproteobacteria bacterium]|nr:hypothetical protein [Gammaproteobacteria bacterium]